MKSKKLKKNSFMQGAFIATLGIVITKVLGILYVIPFYALIGDEAGSLYGYAYNIYMIFLGIGYAGIPLAMSKIISEYNTVGYYKAKKEAFNIGRRVSIINIYSNKKMIFIQYHLIYIYIILISFLILLLFSF